MAFSPETKNPGDLIKSQDWNDTMNEIIRLEDDKVNRDGDTINGQLGINGNVGIGTAPTTERLEVNGSVKANTFTGGGANLTGLNGDQITAGTIPDARIPNTIARDAEVDAKFDANTGHDHDGSNSKRISSGVKGWVRLPFLPKKLESRPEFVFRGQGFTESGEEGAAGIMGIPVPAGVTKIGRFRIIGGANESGISIELVKIGWDNTEKQIIMEFLLKETKIVGEPFNELFEFEKPLLDPEYGIIFLYVEADKRSSIILVAAEFE